MRMIAAKITDATVKAANQAERFSDLCRWACGCHERRDSGLHRLGLADPGTRAISAQQGIGLVIEAQGQGSHGRSLRLYYKT
ncbi:hypothetical protein ACCAA_600012 [Candidatus Accumulibacter aalborgensis]|uniref:Uncharacterized protein n=1 Tax=Candidatus Accumulibacter aalborgensis TaxID=1860102 RepID=A0A1A8XUB2_9PROT|nr:hypothetical protein ACCAA_600012 [Candidatus Accumulibacter aalborgensis]